MWGSYVELYINNALELLCIAGVMTGPSTALRTGESE